MQIVKSIELRDLKDVYEHLVLDYKKWRGYIYRGHEDSSYVLLPSILRDAKKYTKKENLFIYELSLLLKFYRVCNNQGLLIPEIKMFRDMYLTDSFDLSYILTENSGFYWLPDEVFELSALAQHYGIPTRFLDWTQDVQTALHFAAYGNKRSKLKKDSFSVWAINAEWLQELKKFQSNKMDMISRVQAKDANDDINKLWIDEMYDTSLPLRFCTPHYAMNPNLCAQKGILTTWQHNIISNLSRTTANNLFDSSLEFNQSVLDKISSFMEEPSEEPALDIALYDYLNSAENKQYVDEFLNINPLNDTNILFHFIIPSSYTEDLIGILEHQHYGISRLFPGYKGAAETVKDELC